MVNIAVLLQREATFRETQIANRTLSVASRWPRSAVGWQPSVLFRPILVRRNVNK